MSSTTTTATAIISDAYRKLGAVGLTQAPSGDKMGLGLRQLNLLASEFLLAPQLAYTKLETTVTLPAGVNSRTIGPAAQINIARPTRIERESFVRVDDVDYPLDVVDRAGYNEIVQKQLDGPWPRVAFLDGGSPTGVLYVWPMGACELHLVTMTEAASFADLTTQYTLPDGYESLLIYRLACILGPMLELDTPAQVLSESVRLSRLIKRANLEVPQLGRGQQQSDDTTSQLFGLG